MSVIVTDSGFSGEDWTLGFYPAEDLPRLLAEGLPALAIDIANDADIAQLVPHFMSIDMIRVAFPTAVDGRGFSQARHLRMLGYQGRLRAAGHVISDQYGMARRSGFDEVEIPDALAGRQPEAHWKAQTDWRAHNYQERLRRSA